MDFGSGLDPERHYQTKAGSKIFITESEVIQIPNMRPCLQCKILYHIIKSHNYFQAHGNPLDGSLRVVCAYSSRKFEIYLQNIPIYFASCAACSELPSN